MNGPPSADRPACAVRPAAPGDLDAWLALRRALWPETPDPGHRAEIAAQLAGAARGDSVALLAFDAAGRAIGLAELTVRARVDGCASDRVAYLEGWYVVPERRGAGVGRALVAAGERWGRSAGCGEIASDTEAANEGSARAHRALGFEDLGLLRHFRKPL